MLACECLNVIIETESEGQKVVTGELQLTETEMKDPFFRQEIEQVGKLIKINKAHSGLVQTRIVGPWMVHYCLNCGVNSHAVHQQRGAAYVLVATRLLKKDKIEALQISDVYSAIYKIIIPQEQEARYVDDIPHELENTVSNLKQIASDVLAREAAAAEERIRLFTEQQTIALDALRERALNEHKILVRKLVSTNTNSKPSKNIPTERSSLNSPKAKAQKLPDSFPTGNASSQPIFIKTRQAPLSGNVVRGRNKISAKRSERRIRHTSSVDAEGMFQFDTTDEEETTFQSEVDESDNDEVTREDAIGASNDRNPINIAKSLPMDIPVFMSSFQNHVLEDADDSLPSTEDALDIAASIKALAKSVHGDTVFGDLPRPRFSTQI